MSCSILVAVISPILKLPGKFEVLLNIENTAVSVVPAQFCNEIPATFDGDTFKAIKGRMPNLGEVGCALAHIEAYKIFLSDTSDWLVVLEDDALLDDDFVQFIRHVDTQHSTYPVSFLLGHSKTKKSNLWVQRLKQPLGGKLKFSTLVFGQNHWVSRCGVGTVGYIINRKAAEILISKHRAYWLADDWKLFENMGIKVFHPVIPIVWEDLYGRPSSTGNPNQPHHDLFSKKFFRQLSEVVYGRLRLLAYKDY